MTNMTLQEAITIMSSEDEEAAVNNPELWEFVQQIDQTATDILKDKGKDYLAGMLSIIEAISVSLLMSQGMSPMNAIMIVKNDDITKYALLIMKMTVGLCAMEELR